MTNTLHNPPASFPVELVNSQVVLKGCETRGYVILCAARAEVRQRVRRQPAAAAWSGALSAMQYYATVSAADKDQLLGQWGKPLLLGKDIPSGIKGVTRHVVNRINIKLGKQKN